MTGKKSNKEYQRRWLRGKTEEKGSQYGLYYIDRELRAKCGCIYCCQAYYIKDEAVRIDAIEVEAGKNTNLYCEYEKCPYMKEFEGYQTYEDWYKDEIKKLAKKKLSL